MSEYVHGVPKRKVIAAYNHYKSSREAAAALDISHMSVLRVVKAAGIKPEGKGCPKALLPEDRKHWKNGTFYRWLEQNPDEVLPRDMKAIARMSGCSYSSVTSYYYRERKALKAFLSSIPDMRDFDLTLRSIDGELYSTNQLSKYSFRVDRFTLDVLLAGTVGGRTVTFAVPSPAKLYKAVTHAAQESSSVKGKTSSNLPHPNTHTHQSPTAGGEQPGADEEHLDQIR